MSNMPLLHYEQLLAWFGELCAAGALLGCLYLITASVLALRFTRGRKAQRPAASPVTILKPLRGAEPRLFGQDRPRSGEKPNTRSGILNQSPSAVAISPRYECRLWRCRRAS